MTLGAQSVGIKTIYAIEKCPVAAATYRLNFPSVPLYVGDIRSIGELPTPPESAVTILFGGPPCQGFSISNQRTRNVSNPNNWMYQEFIRVAGIWNPEWIVMENVTGILETAGGFFMAETLDALGRAGYSTFTTVLDAADFGVAQRRRRAFIVASRSHVPFTFPLGNGAKTPTVGMALNDLPSLSSGANVDVLPYQRVARNNYARTLRSGLEMVSGNLVTKNAPHILKRYPHVPPGGNWQNIPQSLLTTYKDITKCHTGIYRRLHPLQPSVVIGNFRKNMLIHPTEDRGLSIREAARIQSVPDRFRFSGSIGFQQQQVGNMVPPPLASAVMRRILNQ